MLREEEAHMQTLKRHKELKGLAAVKVQAIWRGYMKRRQDKQVWAARMVQRWWARVNLEILRDGVTASMVRKENMRKFRAAQLIQSQYRRQKARKEVAIRRFEVYQQHRFQGQVMTRGALLRYSDPHTVHFAQENLSPAPPNGDRPRGSPSKARRHPGGASSSVYSSKLPRPPPNPPNMAFLPNRDTSFTPPDASQGLDHHLVATSEVRILRDGSPGKGSRRRPRRRGGDELPPQLSHERAEIAEEYKRSFAHQKKLQEDKLQSAAVAKANREFTVFYGDDGKDDDNYEPPTRISKGSKQSIAQVYDLGHCKHSFEPARGARAEFGVSERILGLEVDHTAGAPKGGETRGSPRKKRHGPSTLDKRVMKGMQETYGAPVTPARSYKSSPRGKSKRKSKPADPAAPAGSSESKEAGGLDWSYSVGEMVADQTQAVIDAQPTEDQHARDSADAELAFSSVREGDLFGLEVMLQHSEKGVNAISGKGDTLLNTAVNLGDQDMVELLLKQPGVDVNLTNALQQGPLHYAAAKGYGQIASLLLERGSRVNETDHEMSTPLHEAASNGHLACLRTLVRAGAKIHAVDKEGCGALHFAAFNGHSIICKELVMLGSHVDVRDMDQRTPLLFAASGGHEYTVATLLELGGDHDAEDKDGWCGLHWAADGGHDGACLEILSAGCSSLCTDIRGMVPLHYAAANGHVLATRVLMQAGSRAWMLGDLEKGWTPIHFAADGGHLAALEAMMNNGAKAKIGDDRGRSPLAVAKANESRSPEVYNVVKYLMLKEDQEDEEEMQTRMTGHRREPKIARRAKDQEEHTIINVTDLQSKPKAKDFKGVRPEAVAGEQEAWKAMLAGAGMANSQAWVDAAANEEKKKARARLLAAAKKLRGVKGVEWSKLEAEFWELMSDGAHEEALSVGTIYG